MHLSPLLELSCSCPDEPESSTCLACPPAIHPFHIPWFGYEPPSRQASSRYILVRSYISYMYILHTCTILQFIHASYLIPTSTTYEYALYARAHGQPSRNQHDQQPIDALPLLHGCPLLAIPEAEPNRPYHVCRS